MDKAAFKLYVDSLTYDKKYQDIEYIDFIGYSSSYKSWERIKNLITWRDKKVADLGCFHGYFSFKAAKEGAIVTGLDRSDEVLKTTMMLNEVYGNLIELKQWEGGQEVSSDFDVALCLNVLHHFADQEKALQNIKSKHAIFEVNQDQLLLIMKYFNIDKGEDSHRSGRIVALGERREQLEASNGKFSK